MTGDKPFGLEQAYALETPEDSRRVYDAWAASYDADFAEAMDYQMPGHVARAFAEAGGAGPVLDVGVGTGLLAQDLRARAIGPVDGTDISPVMLQTALASGACRQVFTADILRPVTNAPDQYAGIVSSGTFTHGHVGPEALDNLLPLAISGAIFALSINAAFFAKAGFAAKLSALEDAGRITGLHLPEVKIYGAAASGDHAKDTGLIALFKTP